MRAGQFIPRALLLGALLAGGTGGFAAMHSSDAYLTRQGDTWSFGTASVARVVALEDGKLRLKSFRAGAGGRELAPPGAETAEWAVLVGEDRTLLTSAMPGWTLLAATEQKLAQGELQLALTLQRAGLRATKTYVIYPQSSVIREWVTFTNAGATPLLLADPRFLNLAVTTGDPAALDFHWMTGGENYPGSWLLQTEQLPADRPRTFDSYEAMAPHPSQFPGDGINAKIFRNDRQIWPAQGWQYVPNATVTVPFDVTADLAAGDRLVFLVGLKQRLGWNTTAFDPTLTYENGETHVASREFSDQQGGHGWRYQYQENEKYVDLVYYPGPKQWRKAADNTTGTPFVGAGDQHPDVGQEAARVWTAPRAGRVHLTGTVCNTGNQGPHLSYGFRMGSSTYAPWAALYNRASRQGLFVGWDYFGHWGSSYVMQPDGAVQAELHVAGYHQTLAPGATITTPAALVGLYRDDLDNAGNECLDWQYRYLWDYTREADGWFPAIRMLGYWMHGTGWGRPGVGWTGGDPDLASTFRKVFRVADLMRSVGADVYHRDWGWWDRAGDWNGPDFKTTGEYLRKSGMGQLIYAFLYTVDPKSQVARAHPDWLLGETLDLSRPEVVAYLRGQLDAFAARWGDFEWRNDSTPTAPRAGDDTPLLGQDQGLRALLRGFLDAHPHCAFQAVNGGGNNAGYDYARYASSVSFSDGAVGPIRNYWAALLLPPDKTSDIPDLWNPDHYDPATWRGLLCINFDMTGDTQDPQKLEGLRQLIDLYHYLHHQGVVGRWVRVYRPGVVGDDPTMYFERLSHDAQRGIIIPKHPCAGAVTLHPKGLLPGAEYLVTCQEGPLSEKRRGDELMARGITLDQVRPGELLYLNLPLHPGSRLDTTPPTPPTAVTTRRARNMGYPGVEITWQPGTDDNWVSYYQVLRDGTLLGPVAQGAYFFDHSVGADLAASYSVRTVDGAGNLSTPAAAPPAPAPRAQVEDDAAAEITYTGAWQHEQKQYLAHAGTLSSSQTPGATATVSLTGRRLLVFFKLGPDCGQADMSVDGGAPEIVDTYSADDIWGICAYEKEFPTSGPHTLRLTVRGDHNPRATASFLRLDGLRAEAD